MIEEIEAIAGAIRGADHRPAPPAAGTARARVMTEALAAALQRSYW